MKKPENEKFEPKIEDSQPIEASTWKAEEAKKEAEEAAKAKPAVRDHHAKPKSETGKPGSHPTPKHDQPEKEPHDKADA